MGCARSSTVIWTGWVSPSAPDWRHGLRVTLAVLAIAVTAALATGPAAALECEGLALDDGCLFTVTGGDTG